MSKDRDLPESGSPGDAAPDADRPPRDRRRDQKHPLPPPRSAATGSGPPRLVTGFWSGIKMLALVNILPLGGAAYVMIQAARGEITLRPIGDQAFIAVGLIACACVLLAVSCWVVLPFARFLRDYPAWYLRETGSWRWVLPAIGGRLAWVLLWVIGVGASGLCAFVILTGLYHLLTGLHGGHVPK